MILDTHALLWIDRNDPALGAQARHALVPHAHPGSVQDRDGGPPLLRASRRRRPFVELAFADAGYAGERVAGASPIHIEIVRKPKGQVGLPPAGVG